MRSSYDSSTGQFPPVSLSIWQLAGILSLPMLLWLAWQLRTIVALALLCLLLAIGLTPTVTFLERHKVPRPLAITLLYLVVLALVGSLLFVASSILAAQFQALLQWIPELLDRWQALAMDNPLLAPPEILQNLLPSGSLYLVGSGITGLLAALLFLVVIYYLLAEREMLWTGTLRLIPAAYRTMVDLLGREIAHKIRSYLRGIALSAFIIGVLTSLGMWALNVPYPLLFGMLAGVLEIVPLVGPVLAALGPTLLALGQSPWHAGLVLLFFIVLQQVEDKLVVVHIQSRATGLHPLVVIFSLLALGFLFGFSGVVLAIPMAAALQATLVCLYSCVYHPNGSAAWLAERQEGDAVGVQENEVDMNSCEGLLLEVDHDLQTSDDRSKLG